MAVPKKKTSRSRRDLRRYSSEWKLSGVNSINCTNCGAHKRQHRICDSCGYYAGREVLLVENDNE